MNPHHYQQQQQSYYNYQQHAPGPPQPPWQAAAAQSSGGWHDPRFQSMPPPPQDHQYVQNNLGLVQGRPSQYSMLPPPPQSAPPSTMETYNRPMSPQYNTTQWGVKYNQGQQNQYQPDAPQSLPAEQRPSLPPRPGSSLAHAVQQQVPVSGYQQPSKQYQPQGHWGSPYQQSQEHMPPTPPPRPAAYAPTPSYGPSPGFAQEQYSHQASTHRYDPQPQPQPQPQPLWQQPQPHQAVSSNASTWSQTPPIHEGPVSPIEDDKRKNSIRRRPVSQYPVPQYVDHDPPSQDVQLPSQQILSSMTGTPEPKASSTALSSFGGGPSDWQHYDPSFPQTMEEEHRKPTPSGEHAELFSNSPAQMAVPLRKRSMERVRPPSKTASPQQSVHYAGGAGTSQNLDSGLSLPVHVLSQPDQVAEHHDSRQSTISSMSGIDHSDTIDNVIQAWAAPRTVDSSIQTSLPPSPTPLRNEQQPVTPKVEISIHEVQTDFKPQIETRVETRTETKQVEIDPYADITNEYKATLKRFAAMLRQEAAAETDEAKFKVFQGFVIRELRLRSVLYGVETQPDEPVKSMETKRNTDLSQVLKSANIETQGLSDMANVTTAQTPPPKQSNLPLIDTKIPTSPKSKDESLVVVDVNGGDDDDYSPGGRPLLSPLRTRTKSMDATKMPITAQNVVSPTHGANGSRDMSPSLNAPMTFDDYIMPEQSLRSNNASAVVGVDSVLAGPVNTQVTGPLNFQPARPVYTPFRYGDGADGQGPSVRMHSPNESFAALRQNQAAESGRTLVHDAPPANTNAVPNRGHAQAPSAGRREHEEAFIGLIRAKSQAIRKKVNTTPRPESPAILRAGTPSSRSTPSPAPVPPLIKSVRTLRSLVPKATLQHPGPKSPPHPKLEPFISSMQSLPDDFSFIHARVLTWDKSNRQLRAKQDADRQMRQSQNEERIDQLFNDNEIGYADIGELEKDFKLEEAGKKYKEDQDELESFTKTVFDFVLNQVNTDIKELMRLQINAADMLDLESTNAAKQVQNAVSSPESAASSPTNAPLSAVMQILVQLHDKLEIRHLKIAEAKFERERRRKRLELSIMYTNNDKAGIRQLEGEFAKAEKIQVLEESRKKAERANRLLDSFDRAAVRGLAENQGVVDDVLTRLQLVRDLIMGSEENGPAGQAREDLLYGQDGVRELMVGTAATIDFLLTDSKTLVELLDKADSMSNNADFELYMSEARLVDATPDKFEQLKSEKAAEDKKVGEELSSRLNGISRAPNEISGLVREVRDKIGADAGHEERIGKALEAAKRRNTGLSGQG